MIILESEGKPVANSSHCNDPLLSPDQVSQNPPPYSPLPQGLCTEPPHSLNIPPSLSPVNYLHINEKNHKAQRKILLDMNILRPTTSVLRPLPIATRGLHLKLGSHNGSVSGEVWVLRANRFGPAEAHGDNINPARERARLHFHTHNGTVKAVMHFHPSTVMPPPFLTIEATAHNGSAMIALPRSFRGQLTLRTHCGRLFLSPALASCASTLSTSDRTYSYFVGERPSSGMWHTDTGGDGDEVDEVIGSCHNGSVTVSYNDEVDDSEDVSDITRKDPRIFSSLLKAMGF